MSPRPVGFDPWAPGFAEDPYPAYDALRQADPCHRTLLGPILLTRYRDVQAVLRSPATSSQQLFDSELREAMLKAVGLWEAWQASAIPTTLDAVILFRDPPDHTRLRGLMIKAFTPRAVEALAPRVAAIVEELLAPARESGQLEVVSELAFPLPALVICELLGVPAEDRDRLRDMSGAAARLVDPLMAPTEFQGADAGLRGLLGYFDHLVTERRGRPGTDVLSRLIAAEEEGDRLSHDELLVNAVLLFAAGHETTKNLIGTALLSLLRHPDQLARWRDDPSIDGTAVEECLRYESPVQMTGRRVVADIELDGTTLRAGDRAGLLLGAANRDPDAFTEPNRFDVARPDVRPLSFGSGIHFCLGAALARLEGRIAIPAVIRGFPDIALAGEPAWGDSVSLRGLRELRVSVSG